MHESNDTRETGFKWEDKSGDNRNEALYCHENIDSVYCISYIETNIESFSSLFGSSNGAASSRWSSCPSLPSRNSWMRENIQEWIEHRWVQPSHWVLWENNMNKHIIKGSEERINNKYIVVFLQGLIFTICQTTKIFTVQIRLLKFLHDERENKFILL